MPGPVCSQPPPRHCPAWPWSPVGPPWADRAPHAQGGGSHPAAAPRQPCCPHVAALWLLGTFQGHSKFLGSAKDSIFHCPAEEKVQSAQGSSRNHLHIFLHLRVQSSRPRAGCGSWSLSVAGLSQSEGGFGAAARPSLEDSAPQDGAAAPPSLMDNSKQIPFNTESSPCLPECTVRSKLVSFIHLLSDSRVFRALFYHPGSCGSERWATCAGSESRIRVQD